MKALLLNISYQRNTHTRFKPFIPFEIMAFVGLIILNNLALSMRFGCKFKSQLENLVVDNYLHTIFSDNTECC